MSLVLGQSIELVTAWIILAIALLPLRMLGENGKDD